jgi:hypothetical protein
MEIPQKIQNKVANRIAALNAKREVEERAREWERRQREEIEDLRNSIRAELDAEAGFIAGWLLELWEDVKTWQTVNEKNALVIFGAPFLNGRPVTDRHAWAVIELEVECGRLFYREKQGMAMEQAGLLAVDLYPVQVGGKQLADKLHPDYLLRFAEAIRSGKVWDFMEQSIR